MSVNISVKAAKRSHKNGNGKQENEVREVKVERTGNRLILPDAPWEDIERAVKQAKESEEQVISFHQVMNGYPLDCIVAVNRAMEQEYGFTHAQCSGMWGPRPPHMIAIKTGPKEGDVVYSVYGELHPVTWEGGYIELDVSTDYPLSLIVSGSFKRKFEKQVKSFMKKAELMLKSNSIYRGHPVELDLSYIDSGSFNPDKHAPTFMDVSRKINLILPREVEFELETELWGPMRSPNDYRLNGVPLKQGILLSGGFGTGKTLTANRTAQLASENGMSFFYLKDPSKFLIAYAMAMLYGPSILFCEDIDAIFGGARTSMMNSLLEALDGIGAKSGEVTCVFTTNYPQKINQAFKRPGRVDVEVKFIPPDADAASRFVKLILGDAISSDALEHIAEVGEAFAGLVPASISGGLISAKKAAIGRHGRDITGKVDKDLLLLAAGISQRNAKAALETPKHPDTEMIEQIKAVIGKFF